MTKRRLLLAGLVALAFAATGRADLLTTTQVTVAHDTTGTLPPPGFNNINAIVGTSAGNFSFENTIGNPNGSNTAGDTRQFVSVGSDSLTQYNINGGGHNSPTIYKDATGTYQVVKVFTVSGTSTALGGGLSQNKITGGAVAYYGLPVTSTYNQFNPLTWGATDPLTGLPGGKLLAQFNLAPAVPIIKGPNGAGTTILDPNQINVIALNTVNPLNSQGDFLAKLDPTKGVVPAFLSNFDTTGLPTVPGDTLDGKGIHVFVNQNLHVGADSGNDVNNPFRFVDPAFGGAPGLLALNTIAAQLGVPFFATGFGPDITGNGFNPYGGPSLGAFPGSGDFGVDFGNTDFPGIFETGAPGVPEIDPSSIAGALTLLGGGLMYLTERRRRSKK